MGIKVKILLIIAALLIAIPLAVEFYVWFRIFIEVMSIDTENSIIRDMIKMFFEALYKIKGAV